MDIGKWRFILKTKKRPHFLQGMDSGILTLCPFGLCNAPATFERLMEQVLQGLNGKICLVYIDDIIVLGENVEDHMSNLGFNSLEERWVKIGTEKMHTLFQERQISWSCCV